MRLRIVACPLILAPFALLGAESGAAAGSIREAAGKAVSVIQISQKTWRSKEGCYSCHQQVLPHLAFREAREHGIAVDEAAAHTDAAWAFGFYSNPDRAVEYTHIIDPAMDDGYGLLAADASGVAPNLVTAVYARRLASFQLPDGHWNTGDERPPQSYSAFTATAVSMVAIQKFGHAGQRAQTEAAISRAAAWLNGHTAKTTEEKAFQIYGLQTAKADPAAIARFAGALKATQQSDGGWSSLDGLASDAYSTGEALWALHLAGIASVDAAWRRGVDYLLRTQAKDGTWHVASRLHPPAPVSPAYIETGHPYGHDQFISTMGECWAVMALAQSLPRVQSTPPQLKEAEPREIEPWAETVLFGSVGDVKKLLDGGLSANAALHGGGSTALMLAAPDVAKMKLLLDRGAQADGRAKNHYSALLVAASYPGSGAAMNLLLDRGARVRLPAGQSAPMFNAFPILLAAFAGNADMIPRLRKAGDRLDDKMNFLGFSPLSPLLALATWKRPEVVRALLDAGAQVDEADGDGITSLGWAAIANDVETAKVLIQRRADVNHVDKKGMTPLLYAASIDFGDASMVDLLLHSGARADARTKEGLTAADLVRKYKHQHLLASLPTLRAAR